MKRTTAIIVILAMCLMLFAACGAALPDKVTPAEPPRPEQPAVTAADAFAGVGFVQTASSYDELYELLSANAASGYGYSSFKGGMTLDGGLLSDAVSSEAPSAPADAAAAETAGGGDGYSGTNVQVEGYDEADTVKTDGKYIYILTAGKLIIASADGAGTKQLSVTPVCVGSDYFVSDGDNDESYRWEWCNDMYLYDGSVIILRSGGKDHNYMKDGQWVYDSETYCYADVYDVSDPAAPRLVTSIGQEGDCTDSRLAGGVLYLVSSTYIYHGIARDDHETFVPCLYDGETRTVMAPGDVAVCPSGYDSSYTVLTSIDLDTLQRTGQAAVYGSYVTSVYMNDSGIYLAVENWKNAETPIADDYYRAAKVQSGPVTAVLRYDISGGIAPAGGAEFDGYMLNQFSMDEYKGSLRVVATLESSSYTVYYDDARGFENYVYDDDSSSRSNSLYIFDTATMEKTGEISGLGQDERVYSVRFDGDVGYFVTFRQTDPLFAVDLSDPSAPTVMSALKIPGFSQYLHVWDKDNLLGIGMSANADTGVTDSMKLSMFDISDKYNVTEIANLKPDCNYSEALYDHHAVFIDTNLGLFGFAGDGKYLLYTYADGAFSLAASCQLDDSYGVRAFYAGDHFYIVSPGYGSIRVLSLEGFAPVATVDIDGGYTIVTEPAYSD